MYCGGVLGQLPNSLCLHVSSCTPSTLPFPLLGFSFALCYLLLQDLREGASGGPATCFVELDERTKEPRPLRSVGIHIGGKSLHRVLRNRAFRRDSFKRALCLSLAGDRSYLFTRETGAMRRQVAD